MFQDSQSSFNPANSVINNGIMPPNGNYIHQTLIQSLDAGDASQISAFSRVLPSYKPQRSSTLND